MTQTEKKQQSIAGRLADRQDYRNTLISRRNGIDVKLRETEAQIATLKLKNGNLK